MQGRKCGQLIRSDEAIDKSPSEVCSTNSVRLALERPAWTPEINHMFPPRFKVTSPTSTSFGLYKRLRYCSHAQQLTAIVRIDTCHAVCRIQTEGSPDLI